jgi:ElaB protein
MSFHSYESRIDDDLELLSETLEEVLRSSGDPADQKYLELKARAERALEEVRNRVSHASDSYYYRAKKAVCRADDYVHEKPWRGIGVGASRFSDGIIVSTAINSVLSSHLYVLPNWGYCFFCSVPRIM